MRCAVVLFPNPICERSEGKRIAFSSNPLHFEAFLEVRRFASHSRSQVHSSRNTNRRVRTTAQLHSSSPNKCGNEKYRTKGTKIDSLNEHGSELLLDEGLEWSELEAECLR